MASVERKQEILSEPLSPDLVDRREAEGWKAVEVVWERQADGEEVASGRQPVPYGLRVAADCTYLERDETEQRAMTSMLELIVADRPFSEIARELNERGFRTREGEPWSQTAVFRMLPRLIEVAPEIYGTPEWMAARSRPQPVEA